MKVLSFCALIIGMIGCFVLWQQHPTTLNKVLAIIASILCTVGYFGCLHYLVFKKKEEKKETEKKREVFIPSFQDSTGDGDEV